MSSEKLLKSLETELKKGLKDLKKHRVDTTILEAILYRIRNHLETDKQVLLAYKTKLDIYGGLIEFAVLVDKSSNRNNLDANWLEKSFALLKTDLVKNVDKLELYRYYQQVESMWQEDRPRSDKDELTPNEQKKFETISQIRNSLYDWVQQLAKEDFSHLLDSIVKNYSKEFYQHRQQLWQYKHDLISKRPEAPLGLPRWVREVFKAIILYSMNEYTISSEHYVRILSLCDDSTLRNPVDIKVSDKEKPSLPKAQQPLVLEQETSLYPELPQSVISQEPPLYPELPQVESSSTLAMLQTLQPNFRSQPSAPPLISEEEDLFLEAGSAPPLTEQEQDLKKELTYEEKQQWSKDLLIQNGYNKTSDEEEIVNPEQNDTPRAAF